MAFRIDLKRLERDLADEQNTTQIDAGAPTFLTERLRGAANARAEAALAEAEQYAPPLRSLPDYVEHLPGVSRVGALSAQAVVEQFERTASEIEQMGVQVTETARRVEALQARIVQALDEVRATAASYRAMAKQIFEEIEGHALLVEEVIDVSRALRTKVKNGPPVPALEPPGEGAAGGAHPELSSSNIGI